MATRRTKSTGVKTCKCDRCEMTLISVPGKRHRRCGGAPAAAPKAKYTPGSGIRGIWR